MQDVYTNAVAVAFHNV